MKFVASFSAGKDSMLALHEMVEAGHEPAALLVMYRQEGGKSRGDGAYWGRRGGGGPAAGA